MPEFSQTERHLLERRWLHAFEDDTDTQKVFRPDSYAFPPARGRTGVEFRSDGSCANIGIAPTDGSLNVEGSWVMDGRNIMISLCDGEQCGMHVMSVDEDRLIIKK